MTTGSKLRYRVVSPLGQLTPGETTTMAVELTNAGSVIDALEVRVEGPDALRWSVDPAICALFPDDSGLVSITMSPEAELEAGSLDLTLVIASTADANPLERIPLTTVVKALPAVELSSNPVRTTKHAKANFTVSCVNSGNVAVELDLSASDPSHSLRLQWEPPTFTLAAHASATATVTARARNKLLGNELAYPIDIMATSPDVQAKTQVIFTQRPLVPRGARTLMILGAIVAAWAIIVVLALTHALGTSPLSKVVPASFYASTSHSGHGVTTPSGAVPKSGIAIGVGGTISGSVVAASDGHGVGRLTVQAFSVNGSHVSLVASAATSSSGQWSIPGLAPGKYALDVSALGFATTWYPNAQSFAKSKLINVQSLQAMSGITITARGLPGTITGTVNTGESPAPTVTVTVLPEYGAHGNTPLATTTTNAGGAYTITNLPTPGTYDLSFSSPGFTVGQAVDTLVGGAHDVANTVVLTSTPGSITGTVTAGGTPLGGVKVTATGSNTKLITTTPTSGPIGTYLLSNLPTPGTYAITFSAPGYGSTSLAEQLGPGQSLGGINVALTGGAGDVAGTVFNTGGSPIGNATVTASVGSSTISATTVTTGTSAGTYLLSNLPTPGTYAITFSAPGYQSETLDITLGTNAATSGFNAKLAPATGTVIGTVEGANSQGLAGATITLTDGSVSVTTVSASSPAGSFELPQVPPGTYSITASLNGYQPNTVQVTVTAGKTTTTPAIVLTSSTQAG